MNTAAPLLIPAVRLARRLAEEAPSTISGTPEGRLPLPSTPTPSGSSRAIGLATVDDRGRIADRSVLGALGWPPGLRVDVRVRSGLLLATASPDGVAHLTSRGHLHLPAGLRYRCRVRARDRVLLAAEPGGALLVVYPPAAMDAMLSGFQAYLLGGEDE
jgi:hypothetical protein